MKIKIAKREFLKYWDLAERIADNKGTQDTQKVFIDADERTELRATNIRTAVTCKACGVTVIEPGQAVIPVKRVSGLFNKADADEFTVDIKDGRATMIAGRSRYHFLTYPPSDFPKLPISASASPFFEAKAGELARCIEWGMLCAYLKDSYPQYQSSVYFDIKNGYLYVVSTDKRNLAMCQAECPSANECSAMMPRSGIAEIHRLLGQVKGDVEVSAALDDAQVYFTIQDIEFSVRRVEGKFPPYENVLPKSANTTVVVEKTPFLAALDRIKVVVGDTNRTVMLKFDNDGYCVLSGISPDFGKAEEAIPCSFSGNPAHAQFLVDRIMAPVNLISSTHVSLSLESLSGHLKIENQGATDFICLSAPVAQGNEIEPEDEMPI